MSYVHGVQVTYTSSGDKEHFISTLKESISRFLKVVL